MTTAKDFVIEKLRISNETEVSIPDGFEPRDVIRLLKNNHRIYQNL